MRTFQNLAMSYQIVRMKTIDEIRRENLALAVKRMHTASALADKAGIDAAYLSQVKNQTRESKTGKPRKMGDDVARKIERAIGEPEGWMDTENTDESSGEARSAQARRENAEQGTSYARPAAATDAREALAKIEAVIDGQHRIFGISDDSAMLLRAALQAVKGKMEPTIRAAVLLMLASRTDAQEAKSPSDRQINPLQPEANSDLGRSVEATTTFARKTRADVRSALEPEEDQDGQGKHGT